MEHPLTIDQSQQNIAGHKQIDNVPEISVRRPGGRHGSNNEHAHGQRLADGATTRETSWYDRHPADESDNPGRVSRRKDARQCCCTGHVVRSVVCTDDRMVPRYHPKYHGLVRIHREMAAGLDLSSSTPSGTLRSGVAKALRYVIPGLSAHLLWCAFLCVLGRHIGVCGSSRAAVGYTIIRDLGTHILGRVHDGGIPVELELSVICRHQVG